MKERLYVCEAAETRACPDKHCAYAKPHRHGHSYESKGVGIQCNLATGETWYKCVEITSGDKHNDIEMQVR